jgi:L-threonylcarbamoyladenylate synthase
LKYVSAAKAGELLRDGKVGLVPTETVVGLVAGEAGLWRLFEIKGRDTNKPIALLCASTERAFSLSSNVPPLAGVLASRFWPGPLTLVLDARGGGTVGARVPTHPDIRALLASHAGLTYATSANRSGESAPRALNEVEPMISRIVDFAIEGESGSGEASAVVDLSEGQVRLLRPADGVTEELLSRLAHEIEELRG